MEVVGRKTAEKRKRQWIVKDGHVKVNRSGKKRSSVWKIRGKIIICNEHLFCNKIRWNENRNSTLRFGIGHFKLWIEFSIAKVYSYWRIVYSWMQHFVDNRNILQTLRNIDEDDSTIYLSDGIFVQDFTISQSVVSNVLQRQCIWCAYIRWGWSIVKQSIQLYETEFFFR